ncbi:DUF6017 domain-containing protein [Lachnospiraceae bacterium EP-SM-12S-S03]|nr:DUF6017 domain-containing protein [Lachnospiraceae bacterium EP-SM-12S-S03]
MPFHSLNPSPLEDAAQPPERKRKEATDAYSVYEEIIKDNIEYDYLIQDRYLDRDRIEEILALILETVCTKRRTIRIAGDDHPAELVKAKFMKLNSEHIRFVLDCMQENTTKIRNIKQYMKAALFNAPSTIGKNFTTLLEMINASEAREDDPEFQSPVDLMFERLEEKDPEHFAVRQYKKFLLSAGKTRSSILISCGARLAPFDIKELRDLMETDEMELDTIGDRKTALFVIISDTDDTFNFVVSILYTQLFNLLCDKADDEYGGRLPVHVRCLLDEFANIGQIPKFEKLIATIRSREISASIILQSQSQLKAIYKDNADTIVGNCDTTLFLGGKEKTTLKEMSEILGKETIDSFNTSENRGREVSHGLNYQKLGKQLMTEDEIAVMDGGKCILQLRGVRPFFSDKYDITKHPNYKYLSDYDKKNTFDMEKHLRRRPALVKSDEAFDYYEISEADLQEDTDHE